MKTFSGRRSRGYDGPGSTSRMIGDLASNVMDQITQVSQERPDLVLAAWPEVIGPQLARMTEALSFREGVLSVRVKNSTLYSLLNQREKGRILALLRKRFPKTTFANVLFRMG